MAMWTGGHSSQTECTRACAPTGSACTQRVHSSRHVGWLGKALWSWELLVPGGASWQLPTSPLPLLPVSLDAENF